MKTRVLAGPCLVAALVATILAGCCINGDVFKARFTRSEELTAPVAGITKMDVSTNVGKIKLTAADVAEIRISAEIKVKAATEEKARELAEGVRIEAEPSGQTLVVRAVKPPGFGRNELSVDFTIAAPAGLTLRCTTNVGDIRTEGFTSRVEAHTDVGTITCLGLRGDVDLHANVGDIRAEYASDAPAAISADSSTNVGRIDFAGPQKISAKLTAAANVGDIESDRPLTVSGHLKQSINATLGNAEGRISLRTNVGSIRIH